MTERSKSKKEALWFGFWSRGRTSETFEWKTSGSYRLRSRLPDKGFQNLQALKYANQITFLRMRSSLTQAKPSERLLPGLWLALGWLLEGCWTFGWVWKSPRKRFKRKQSGWQNKVKCENLWNTANRISFVLTVFCWFCLLKENRTRVLSQPTRRSPVTGQHATATGRSDKGISMISICTPPRWDAPRSRWPNKRTPTRAFSSACTHK